MGTDERRLKTLDSHLRPSNAFPGSSRGLWETIPEAPPDPILGITESFNADSSENRLNLGVGAYRTEELKPLVLGSVKKAERIVVEDPTADKEYQPIGGNPNFCALSRRLALGGAGGAEAEGRVATVQCLSGTGALRVGAEFLAAHHPLRAVHVPDPTWGNHPKIFGDAGLQVRRYRYYHPATRGLDYTGMLQDLRSAPNGSVVVLHACAHNPTGVDPSKDQWRGILQAVCDKGHLVFFDSAYQGFASGDLEEDAFSVRLFADAGLEMVLAQSFAKNMGLYGERVGALSFVTATKDAARRVESQLKSIIRALYSSPPRHGAAIAEKVLSNADLFEEWKTELRGMAERIKQMRTLLHSELTRLGTPGSWTHILEQIGMFSYTGLTKAQCENMRKWHVYMSMDGRISMAGLSRQGCPHLAAAIDDSVRRF
uniref:Aspartate aminotransferase n=1 Tax=Tetraselmis sp. GSL018 TaxID=582737 RepID=A0A061SBP2_9CHLO